MLGDPFAERQVDPVGVIDEEAQRFVPGLLEGDEVELASRGRGAAAGCLLEVFHWFGAKKKWARPTSRTLGTKKLKPV